MIQFPISSNVLADVDRDLANGNPIDERIWNAVCFYGSTSALEKAIMLGADVNAPVMLFRKSPPIIAFAFWDRPIAYDEALQKTRLLLQHGGNPSMTTLPGETPANVLLKRKAWGLPINDKLLDLLVSHVQSTSQLEHSS